MRIITFWWDEGKSPSPDCLSRVYWSHEHLIGVGHCAVDFPLGEGENHRPATLWPVAGSILDRLDVISAMMHASVYGGFKIRISISDAFDMDVLHDQIKGVIAAACRAHLAGDDDEVEVTFIHKETGQAEPTLTSVDLDEMVYGAEALPPATGHDGSDRS